MFTLSLISTGTAYVIESWDGLRSEVYKYNNTDDQEEKRQSWDRAVQIVAERYGKYIPLTCLKLAGHAVIAYKFAPHVIVMLDFLVQRLKRIWNSLNETTVLEKARAAFQEMKRCLEEFAVMIGLHIADFLRAVGENLGRLAHGLFQAFETVAFFICTSISNEFTIYCVQVQGIYKGILEALKGAAAQNGKGFIGFGD